MNYCKVGDLAITVNAYHPQNIGKVVRVMASKGIGPWPDLEGPQQIWEIVSTISGVSLIYSVKDIPYLATVGEAPDHFLRPLRPLDIANATKTIVEKNLEEELEYV